MKPAKEYLDAKDRQILLELQKDGRESLTNIAKKINVAIDTVKARIERLEKDQILVEIKPWVNPRNMGYPLIADVKIKLHNNDAKQTDDMIAYLVKHQRVIEVITIMGDYDLTAIIIAKDTDDLGRVSQEIRHEFNYIIADWRAFLTLKIHKFEQYDYTTL